MNASRFSRIIGKCPRKLVCDLAHPIMEKYDMQVLRNPVTTLVMVQMRETVTGARFYLGETFLRAIPSIIWVLLILVCVGFGPAAGIIGISIFSTSFFAKSFAQRFEEVSPDTLEALSAIGAGRVKIFFAAVLPSAVTGILAWTSISFEKNFESSAVLGTVGAGGIGYVISNCMNRYAYGQAIVAIALVLLFTYAMELGFTVIKEQKGNM